MLMKQIVGAAAVLMLSAGVAAAAPAVVQTDLNARSGPGTGYPVVTTLPAGSTVDVLGCDGSWCRIDLGGGSAYASRRYLAVGGAGAGVAVVPDYDPDYAYGPGYVYGPDYDPYYSPGYIYGPGIGIYSGPNWRYSRRHRDGRNWRSGQGSGQWQGRGAAQQQGRGAVQQQGRGIGQQWQGRSSGRAAITAPQGMGRGASPQFQAPSRGTVGMGRGAAPARSVGGDRDSSRRGAIPAAPSAGR